MSLELSEVTIKNVLTRTTGFLKTVTSHSLQPYRGCTLGNSLCGVGCYVQHNGHVLKGRRWGSFLEVRTNAAESYAENYEREKRWAQRNTANQRFSIFMSSATEPFLPQEARYQVTQRILEAMLAQPPDELVVQTHTHRVTRALPTLSELNSRSQLRVHVSIETDRDGMPDLPPHASSVDQRFDACQQLRAAGIRTIVTVSPLLPIEDPLKFFSRIAEVADAVVIDHFVEGDGSSDGHRTAKTRLPSSIQMIDAAALHLDYRDRIVSIAKSHIAEVGVNIDGFAGRLLT